ncbi:MAG TPA: AMP-binding protein [Gammaproteobacteria bacterium]|nr:AMP-binding protein [Gammaproteobacteria bacterium]
MLDRRLDAPLAIRGTQTITCGDFLAAAIELAARLPDRPEAINLCAERYTFMLSFLAAVLRGQCNLLPPARQGVAVQETLRSFPQAYVLRDGPAVVPGAQAPEFVVEADRLAAGAPLPAGVPSIAGDQIAAVVFTSGSTGAAQAVAKSWRTLAAGALVNRRHRPGDAGALCGMVATVPPWHMYGLEWSLMLPLVSECAVHCGDAFYPADILRALEHVPAERVLVSTPLHLRAMVRSKLRFPGVRTVLCATAPLDPVLARDVERLLSAQVFEIYGCSEAGSMACRWPAREPEWRFFDEFRAESEHGAVRVTAAHLPAPVQLADAIEFMADGRFALHGRAEDIVKIGGRRASLGELNNRLLALDGVDDAIVFHPASLGLADTGRLAALVVSKSRSARHIRRELAAVVDRVFLPRPIRLVDALPRSATGKLRRRELLELIGDDRST